MRGKWKPGPTDRRKARFPGSSRLDRSVLKNRAYEPIGFHRQYRTADIVDDVFGGVSDEDAGDTGARDRPHNDDIGVQNAASFFDHLFG